MNQHNTLRVVVDRRERNTLVLLDDDDRSYEVDSRELPASCRAEGAVLDVPLSDLGEPKWKRAVRNTGAEKERLRESRARIERLRARDPGGDVEL